MAESKRSRKMKRRWQRAAQIHRGGSSICWERYTGSSGRHTCTVSDPLHTGPHQCCCDFEWETSDS